MTNRIQSARGRVVLSVLIAFVMPAFASALGLKLEASLRVGAEKTFDKLYSFKLPDSIPVSAGQAENHKAEFSFGDTAKHRLITCVYKGPGGARRAYLFFKCEDSSKAGQVFFANSFKLALQPGNNDVKSRNTVAILELNLTPKSQTLPPDPGEAGMQTLEGIDSDHDGVRDDIQRWISFRFPDSEKRRAALRQLAVDYQDNLLTVSDKASSIASTHRFLNSISCAMFVLRRDTAYVDFIRASNLTDSLQAEFLNTMARSKAYLQAGRNFSGQVHESARNDYQNCRFDLGSMEN